MFDLTRFNIIWYIVYLLFIEIFLLISRSECTNWFIFVRLARVCDKVQVMCVWESVSVSVFVWFYLFCKIFATVELIEWLTFVLFLFSKKRGIEICKMLFLNGWNFLFLFTLYLFVLHRTQLSLLELDILVLFWYNFSIILFEGLATIRNWACSSIVDWLRINFVTQVKSKKL